MSNFIQGKSNLDSEYIYSNSVPLLPNGATIDSGWHDVEKFSKYQFLGLGGDNLTFTIYSSNINGGGGSDVPPTNVNSTDFTSLSNLPCRQKFMRWTWTNNSGTPVVNPSLEIKCFKGSTEGLTVSPLNIPPASFSQAALVKASVIGSDSDGIPRNALVNKGGAIVAADFFTEVAVGGLPGFQMGTKFGRNPQVNTASDPEDMWDGGGAYTGQPLGFTPETVDVFSSLAADTSAGTGARTIRITGLKSNTSTEYESEDIILNGTTAVTSVNTWWRVNRVVVLTAGSGENNAGNITVRSTTTVANVFDVMPIGYGQSTICAFTVPFGKVMVIKRVRIAITRANGSAGSSTITLRLRPPNGVYNAVRVFELSTNNSIDYVVLGGDPVPAGSDMKIRIEQVSDNGTVVEGAIEYILIDI